MNNPITPPPTKGRGCFFYGCLTGVVAMLLLLLLAFFTARYFQKKLSDYTDTQPVALPRVEMPDGEFKELQARVKAFGQALDQGKPAEPLVLTEREINALMGNSDAHKQLADHVHVTLEGNEVKGQISLPLSRLGWIGKGRYLNGEASFNVSLENGVLIVTAREVRVKGKPLPEAFMSKLRQENLAKEAYKDPKNAEALRKLEQLKIEDGKAILKARAAR